MQELYGLAERIGAQLKARGEKVVVAEATAGGLVSAALLSVDGASGYYLGGTIIYTSIARDLLLGKPAPGAVSMPPHEERALLMAREMRERFGATWGLGESGIAGPTGKTPGRTVVALAGPLERVSIVETGSDDRRANMFAFAEAALRLLADAIA